MPKLQVAMAVEMADGRMLSLTVDQRDYAALEAADIGPDQPHTYGRHLAYTAACRAGLYSKSWEDFNTRDCVETIHASKLADAEGDEDGLDPTQAPPTAGSA